MTNETYHCLNCERTEAVVPLVSLRYKGDRAWICASCLPILIHKPGQLAGKLASAETLVPASPDTH